MVEGIGTNTEAAQRILSLFREQDLDFTRSARPNVQAPRSDEPAIRIISTLNTIMSGSLRYYLRQRCIDPGLASRWCHEVDFRIESTDRRLFAIGFPNDRGDWVLRNSFFKGCSGQGISTVVRGNQTVGPVDAGTIGDSTGLGSGTVAVFEGLFDFLSWLTVRRSREPECDAVVLNSTSNVAQAVPFLKGHANVELWLDNDEAGRHCAKYIRDHCPESTVVDMSPTYSRYNDLNDWLVCETVRIEKEQVLERGIVI